jgi:CarD family transcriptional regulator
MTSVGFKVGDTVVYPSHGVGQITSEETQLVGGHQINVFVISLNKDKLTLRVPVKRASAVGLRQISTHEYIDSMINTLKSKPRVAKGMWSKRAQEYEMKINSGDLVLIAEVLRDLFKNIEDPDRSYSERVIFEAALNRLAGEYAAVELIDHLSAIERIKSILYNSEAANLAVLV